MWGCPLFGVSVIWSHYIIAHRLVLSVERTTVSPVLPGSTRRELSQDTESNPSRYVCTAPHSSHTFRIPSLAFGVTQSKASVLEIENY